MRNNHFGHESNFKSQEENEILDESLNNMNQAFVLYNDEDSANGDNDDDKNHKVDGDYHAK